MKRLLQSKLPAVVLCFGLCLLMGTALLAGDSAARFTNETTGSDTARTAAFDVEIIPPDGIYTGDVLPTGSRNQVAQANAERMEQVFTLVNHGEVTVEITPNASGWKDTAWTLDVTPAVLRAGEWCELVFVLEGSATGLQETVADIDLTLTIEQVD